MSAGDALRAAVLAHLRANGPAEMAVFDAPPVRGSVPYAVIGEPVLGAADAAGVVGRLGTLSIAYADAGERPVRLRRLVGAAEEALTGMVVDLGGGWRLVGMRLVRSRIAVAADRSGGGKGSWQGASDFAVRIFRIDS